mgnify:FL=1
MQFSLCKSLNIGILFANLVRQLVINIKKHNESAMEDRQRTMKDRNDSDILFSRTVKAGKRVYYIDVKRDRKGDYYLSLTESKRLKEMDDMQKPTFEKHKIFLYREDFNKFQRALGEAADFAQQEAHNAGAVEWAGDYAPVEGMSNYEEEEDDEQQLGLELEF